MKNRRKNVNKIHEKIENGIFFLPLLRETVFSMYMSDMLIQICRNDVKINL